MNTPHPNEALPPIQTLSPEDKLMLMSGRLTALQADIPEIEKTKEVDAGGKKYKHAELDKFMGTVLPIIRRHQLYLSFHTIQTPPVIMSDSVVQVGCEQARLTCAVTGLSIGSDVPLLVRLETRSTYSGTTKVTENNLMQGLGSAITYAKRYALFDILGIAPEVGTDDDGHASSHQENKSTHVSYHKKVEHLSESCVPPKTIEAKATPVLEDYPVLSVDEQLDKMNNIRALFELKHDEAFKNNPTYAERLDIIIRTNFKELKAENIAKSLHKAHTWLSGL